MAASMTRPFSLVLGNEGGGSLHAQVAAGIACQLLWVYKAVEFFGADVATLDGGFAEGEVALEGVVGDGSGAVVADGRA